MQIRRDTTPLARARARRLEELQPEAASAFSEAAGGRTHVQPAEEADSARWEALRVVQMLAILVGTLLFAALLNADHLVDRAGKKPFGGSRDFWLAVWEPFQDVSDATYLNRPRRWLDEGLGREPTVARPATSTPTAGVEQSRPGATAAETAAATEPGIPPESPAAAPATPAPRLRTGTPEAPLRMWVGGDSMAVALGGSLLRLASGTGVIAPSLDARSSTGLTRPDYFDWPTGLAAIAEKQKPDVIVVIFGANDSQGIRTPEGKIFQPKSEGWLTEYRRRVGAAMDLVAGQGRLVIWVGQPAMEADGFAGRMQELNTIYREEAATRDGILFFDSWPLFVDASGKYNSFLADDDGALQEMRQGDGVHLSLAGANRLASAILKRLNDETPILKP